MGNALRRWFERQSHALVAGVCVAGVFLLGWLDYATSYEFSLAVFYLAPILGASWVAGRTYGLGLAVTSAVLSVVTDLLSGLQYSSLVFHVWAGTMRTVFFAVAVMLLVALRDSLARERTLARRDALTGLANRTAFFEAAGLEVERLRRYGHPLTVGFIDCDQFKAVNDTQGHEAGDRVLVAVAGALRHAVRQTDLAARIGGDEFALLFPELGEQQARDVLGKLQGRLLEAMRRDGWPVTFSIGVVTCLAPPISFDAVLAQADTLMYAVKTAGRNAVQFALFDASPPPRD